MTTVSKCLENTAVSALNLGARILKPVINYAQKEQDVFLKTNLAKDAQKLVGQLAKDQGKTAVKASASIGAVMSTLNGVWMSCFYIWNNLRSKDIPEERKTTLNINIVITTLLALGIGAVLTPVMGPFTKALQSKVSGQNILKKLSTETIGKITEKIATDESLIKKAVTAMPESAGKPLKETAAKFAPAYVENIAKDGIRSIVDLLYITAAFRFIGPVAATPLADRANKFLIRHGFIKPEKTVKPCLKPQDFFSIPAFGISGCTTSSLIDSCKLR